MALGPNTILTIIAGVAGVTGALVAPLYVLVLRMRHSNGQADQRRESLSEEQGEIAEELDEISEKLETIRVDVEENALRSEQNQRHIHQLLVGEHNSHDRDIGNPHYTPKHCPLEDSCPWHDHG